MEGHKGGENSPFLKDFPYLFVEPPDFLTSCMFLSLN